MAPLRSIGNKDSAFDDFYASTGTDASSAILKASGGDFEFVENGEVFTDFIQELIVYKVTSE